MTRREWIFVMFGVPIVVLLSLLVGNVIASERKPPVGRACYTRTFVHPFSRDADTAELTLCFRTPVGP